MVNKPTFKCIIKNTTLLDKHKNKLAKDYWFNMGSKIFKNKTIEKAKQKIIFEIQIKNDLFFWSVFKYFYQNSIYSDILTHYINLTFLYKIKLIIYPIYNIVYTNGLSYQK